MAIDWGLLLAGGAVSGLKGWNQQRNQNTQDEFEQKRLDNEALRTHIMQQQANQAGIVPEMNARNQGYQLDADRGLSKDLDPSYLAGPQPTPALHTSGAAGAVNPDSVSSGAINEAQDDSRPEEPPPVDNSSYRRAELAAGLHRMASASGGGKLITKAGDASDLRAAFANGTPLTQAQREIPLDAGLANFYTPNKPIAGMSAKDAEAMGLLPPGSAAKMGSGNIPTSALGKQLKPNAPINTYRQEYLANRMKLPPELESVADAPIPNSAAAAIRAAAGQDAAFKNAEANRAAAANLVAQKAKSAGSPKNSAGQKAMDTAFAKDWASYAASGGQARAESDMNAIQAQIDKLKKYDTGMLGNSPGYFGDKGIDLAQPGLASIRDASINAFIGSAKENFPGRMTNTEFEKYLQGKWNPRLGPVENANRHQHELDMMRQKDAARRDAGEYFTRNGGSLLGFNPNLSNSRAGVDYSFLNQGGSPSDSSGNPNKRDVQGSAKKLGISMDTVNKIQQTPGSEVGGDTVNLVETKTGKTWAIPSGRVKDAISSKRFKRAQ